MEKKDRWVDDEGDIHFDLEENASVPDDFYEIVIDTHMNRLQVHLTPLDELDDPEEKTRILQKVEQLKAIRDETLKRRTTAIGEQVEGFMDKAHPIACFTIPIFPARISAALHVLTALGMPNDIVSRIKTDLQNNIEKN